MDSIPLHIDASRALQSLDIKEKSGRRYVFDPVRRHWYLLTKEEWVRQVFIRIISEKVSLSRVAVEKSIKVNQRLKRFDLVIMDRQLRPFLLAEFKSPAINLNDQVFRQAAVYNSTLRVPYLLISNGFQHYLCRIDLETKAFTFLAEFPEIP